MTPIICPSITAYEPHEFREQIDRVSAFAHRLHIDLMDGDFAPTRSIAPIQVYWPTGMIADIHLMFRRPAEQIETIISLQPSLLIIPAEAEGNIRELLEHVRKFSIKTGVALLPQTAPDAIAGYGDIVDHVLLFSGDLGKFGGTADLTILEKIPALKSLNSNLEIGWDGGVNDQNAEALVDAGVSVLNVGGFIQRADDAHAAYDSLLAVAK